MFVDNSGAAISQQALHIGDQILVVEDGLEKLIEQRGFGGGVVVDVDASRQEVSRVGWPQFPCVKVDRPVTTREEVRMGVELVDGHDDIRVSACDGQQGVTSTSLCRRFIVASTASQLVRAHCLRNPQP
jgi:hypothetical protein